LIYFWIRAVLVLPPERRGRRLEASETVTGSGGDQGIYTTAVQELKKSLELYPQGDPDVYSNLGTIHHQMQQYDEALVFYDRGLKLNPGDADIHFNIAKCLLSKDPYRTRDKVHTHLHRALDLYGPVFAEKRQRVSALLSELAG
jgi:tetratricopeptide (TPR) repeat protein